MAGFRVANLLARQVLAQTRLQQRQVALLGFFQQRVNGGRFGGFETIDVQRGELRVVVARHLTQLLQRVVEVVARGHFVRQHVVVLRAGVLHVGNRHQAHVKALGGLIELAVNRLFLRFGIGKGVNRAQHLEIGGRGVQHQRLLIGLIGHVLNACGFFLQRQGAPFGHIENGLG